MDKTQPNDARIRMQALLAVPESQRTEAEWDELHELEIMLAPGNRLGAPGDPGARRAGPGPGGQGPGGHPGSGMPHRKKPGKKFHRRPLKRNAPGGGMSGGGT